MPSEEVLKKQKELAELAKKSGWVNQYLDLKSSFKYTDKKGNQRKLSWKQAAFVAWFSCPKKQRLPRTQEEITIALDLRTSLTLRNWRKTDWWKEVYFNYREQMFLDALSAVDRKTISTAQDEDGMIGVASRKLYYELFYNMRKETISDHDLDELIKEEIERRVNERVTEILSEQSND